MREECEAAAYDVAMSGNPGGMFILKANYGYTEQPQQIVISQGDQGKSLEQIAAEHVQQITDSAAPAAESSAPPELPDV